ncbi:MAG: hypothetical protein HY073_02925 [Deltaproteobacteria bacterium]|nr:hypothetical protein [Deltaproteobacteria bacterium]
MLALAPKATPDPCYTPLVEADDTYRKDVREALVEAGVTVGDKGDDFGVKLLPLRIPLLEPEAIAWVVTERSVGGDTPIKRTFFPISYYFRPLDQKYVAETVKDPKYPKGPTVFNFGAHLSTLEGALQSAVNLFFLSKECADSTKGRNKSAFNKAP